MPYAVLTVGIIIIAISIYLAAKQPAALKQVEPGELEELVAQIQLAADDAIARVGEELERVQSLTAEQAPPAAPLQLSDLAQRAQTLSGEGLTKMEIAAELGRGTGEIELALGLAKFTSKEQNHE